MEIYHTSPIYECEPMEGNFKLFFHLPNEIPTSFHPYTYVEVNSFSKLILSATYHKSSDDLRKFSPKNREMFFDGERKLKFFKTYTKNLCFFECLSNFTLKQCGCVKFSMPRDSKTAICNITMAQCYIDAKNDWLDMKEQKPSDIPCDCWPSSTDIKYYINQERKSTE